MSPVEFNKKSQQCLKFAKMPKRLQKTEIIYPKKIIIYFPKKT